MKAWGMQCSAFLCTVPSRGSSALDWHDCCSCPNGALPAPRCPWSSSQVPNLLGGAARCSDAAGKDQGLGWAVCRWHSEHGGGSSRGLGGLRELRGAVVGPEAGEGTGESPSLLLGRWERRESPALRLFSL